MVQKKSKKPLDAKDAEVTSTESPAGNATPLKRKKSGRKRTQKDAYQPSKAVRTPEKLVMGDKPCRAPKSVAERKNGQKRTAKNPQAAGTVVGCKGQAPSSGGSERLEQPETFVPSQNKAPSRAAVRRYARGERPSASRGTESELPVTDDVIRGIARMKSEGFTASDIARHFLITTQNVNYYYRKYIWPSVMEDCVVEFEVSLDRIRHYMKRCWEIFADMEEHPAIRAAALTGIRWAIEHSAKIQGHYAPETLKIEQAETFRVAGLTAEEVQDKLGMYLADHIERRRRIEDKKNVLAAVRYTEPVDMSSVDLEDL